MGGNKGWGERMGRKEEVGKELGKEGKKGGKKGGRRGGEVPKCGFEPADAHSVNTLSFQIHNRLT